MQTSIESGPNSDTPATEQLSIQVQQQAQQILQNSQHQIQEHITDKSSIHDPRKSTNTDQNIQTEETNDGSTITKLEEQLVQEQTKNNVVKLQNARKTKQIKQLNALLTSLKDQFDTDDVSNIPNLYKASLTHIQLLQEQNKSLQLETSQLKSLVQSHDLKNQVPNKEKQNENDPQSLQASECLKSENILLSSKQVTQLHEDKPNENILDNIFKNNIKQTKDQNVGTSQIDDKVNASSSQQDKIAILNSIITELNKVIEQYKTLYGSLSLQENNIINSQNVQNFELTESNGDGIHMIHKRKYNDVIQLNKQQLLLMEQEKSQKSVKQLRHNSTNKLQRSSSSQNVSKSALSSSLCDDTAVAIKPIEYKELYVQTSVICSIEQDIQTDELLYNYENKSTDTNELILSLDKQAQTEQQPITEHKIYEETSVQTYNNLIENCTIQVNVQVENKQTQNEPTLLLTQETQTECYDYKIVEQLSKETQCQLQNPDVKQELSIESSQHNQEQQDQSVQTLIFNAYQKLYDDNQQSKPFDNLNKSNSSPSQTDHQCEQSDQIINQPKQSFIIGCQQISNMILALQNMNKLISQKDETQLHNQQQNNQEENSALFTQQQNKQQVAEISENVSQQEMLQIFSEQMNILQAQILESNKQNTQMLLQYQQVSQDKQVLIKQLEQESIATSLLKNKLSSALNQLQNNKEQNNQSQERRPQSPLSKQAQLFKNQLSKFNNEKETRSKAAALANRLELERLQAELKRFHILEQKCKSLQIENTQLRVQNTAYHKMFQQQKQ